MTAAVAGTVPAGLTVTVDPAKATAKATEKVTVTVTVKGSVDKDTTLTLANGNWVSNTVPAGATLGGNGVLTLTSGIEYNAQIQYTVTVSNAAVDSTVTVAQ